MIFIIGFALIWNPLSFFPIERTHLEHVKIGEDVQLRFTICYALMCVTLAIFRLVIYKELRWDIPRGGGVALTQTTENDLRDDAKLVVLGVIVLAVFASVFLSSSEYRAYLVNIYDYVRGGSLISYGEYRRGTHFAGFVMTNLHVRAASIFYILFAVWILLAVKRRSWALPLCVLAFASFVVGGASFKKAPYVFYLVSAFGVSYYFLRAKGMQVRRLLPLVFAAVLAGSILMVSLYIIQYRDNESVTAMRSLETAYFRIFHAIPGAFKLYCELYPEAYDFTFGRSIGLLQPILGYAEQPYSLVPAHYGAGRTTFPGGYISYAYADFGYVGVIIYSALLMVVLTVLDRFVAGVVKREVKIVAIVCLGLSALSVHTLPLSTALLTGGLALSPVLVHLMDCAFRHPRLRQRAYPFGRAAKTRLG